MELMNPEMSNLFMQLGLPASDEAISDFINTHQLPSCIRLPDAPYWTRAQAEFLREGWSNDADWAVIIEELNEKLH